MAHAAHSPGISKRDRRGIVTLGCVVGKFWPPHNGHLHLIETARQQCDELHVVVIHRREERPTGELRLEWMTDLVPDATVHLTLDDIPNESQAWAQRTIDILGRAPDVVFTSETYGETWAAELGCDHVCVDLDRSHIPISATVVRDDPFAHWHLLPTPTRAFYARRVVIVGAESTGKTTLAQHLADYFETPWVPEWARTYGDEMGFTSDEWEADESLFDKIVVGQPASENATAAQSHGLVMCDTDLLATIIWHETYRPDANAERASIVQAHDRQRARINDVLYLLCVDDTPWVQDGTRNRGSGDPTQLGSRPWFTARFREELARRGERVVELSGSFEKRTAEAIAAVAAFSRVTPRS